MKDITNPLYTAILRQKAEEILKSRNVKFNPDKIDAETLKLIHELDVHQVELEMQNEELVLSKKKAEEDAEKFANLYDFAPSGYLTLSKEGEIVELNFRSAEILGKERSLLIKNRFGFFVSDGTRKIFNEFIDTLLNSKTNENCELVLNINPETPTHVYLTGKASKDEEQCLITMMDISEIKKAEEETKANEEKYRSLFENNIDSIIIASIGNDPSDVKGSFIKVNKAAIELYGYSNEEMLLMTFKDLYKATKKVTRDRDKEFLEKGKLSFETIAKTKKGNKRNIKTESFLIEYNGKPAIMNLSRDITERKQNAENARKVLENLTTILDAIPDLLFEVGLDGRIYHCQSPDKTLLAFPPEQFLGKLFHEVLPLNAAEICIEAILEAFEKGHSTGKQYSLELAHKKYWFEISVSPIKESNDKDKRFIFIAHDITELKLAQDELLESEKKLATLFNVVNSGIVMSDNKGNFILFNDKWAKMLGYTREELSNMNISEIIHPDEKEKSKETISKIAKGELERLQYERLYLRKDKSSFWGEVSFSVLKKTENDDFNIVTVVVDISERKQAEDLLREAAERYRGLSDATYEAIFISEKGICLEQNRSAQILFGYTAEEAIGKPGTDWIAPEDREIVKKNMLSGYAKPYEVMALRKDGSKFPCILLGKTMNYRGRDVRTTSLTNITERKLAEEKLQKNQEFLKQTQIIAKLGSYSLDFSSQKWTSTSVLDTIFGIDVDFDKSIEGWQSIIHPDWKTIMNDYLNNEIIGKKNNFNKEYKIVKIDTNEERWVHGLGEIIYNKENEPIQLIGTIQDITDKKITEETLRESEEKYRGLVENSPDAIIIYTDDKIVFVNEEGLRMTGAKSDEEIIGKSVLDFIHQDSKDSIIQRMKDVLLDNNASATVEERFVNFAGEAVDAEIKAIPTIYDHKIAVQVILHDVTDRKRTQEKIQQLSQAVEQSPVTIVITNTKGEIEYTNPKFTETTGYTFNEVTGKNPRVLKSGYTSPEEYQKMWQALTSGNEWHGEFHNKKKNGEFYWESASISPIVNAQGKTTHYIAIKEDITDKKNVQEELLKAKERAEESDRLKLVFLANMSHEIRTPMNGILGFTELLKEPKLSGEEQQQYIQIIEKSGKRMLNIINDIISISKVESGQVDISLSETNVNEQIDYLKTFFKPEATQKGLQLIVAKQLAEKDSIISTDKEKIYAILTNLVKNALKFTNSGSIKFGCIKKDTNLEFFVKDSGSGIPLSQQHIIFERFRQANETLTRTHEGSGLGLAISKAYVEMLGGKIWVESEEGIGSTFYFTIPFNDGYESQEKIAAAKEESTIKVDNKVKDLKVLIVEDDAISKLLITIAVKTYSKEILKVGTGFEAIETCRNNSDIDLVMMDINMPEMGGYEATKQIREFNKDIVIIAQTANGMQSDRDDAIAAGCTDYISKPVNIASLSELIQKYFGK